MICAKCDAIIRIQVTKLAPYWKKTNRINSRFHWDGKSADLTSPMWGWQWGRMRSQSCPNLNRLPLCRRPENVCIISSLIIGAARLTSEMFSHTSPSQSVSAIFQMWFGFFYKLLKFDVVNADIPFYKWGHNFEREAKLNRARHTFSNEVSLIIWIHA